MQTQASWNERYRTHTTVYGIEPNAFFKSFIDQHKAGSLLLPAEGEGRNAVYAAKKGWQVDAFDFSTAARQKALARAAREKVMIHYDLLDIQDFTAKKQYDAVGLLYIHLPPSLRKQFHAQVYQSIRPGGFLILEAFAKEQLQFTSGGPKEAALLYDAPSLCHDFHFLHILNCQQKELVLDEGPYHQGSAAILRLLGQKL